MHRFNKAQQDALLPHVENGTIILIGATTENPYFAVNRALTSRSRIFQLRSLDDADLHAIAEQALGDAERGYGGRCVSVQADAMAHLVKVANGDARGVLNALELAVETTPPQVDGRVVIDMQVAEESIQQRAVLYDKEGDYHYDTISAFIKSLRGSDPDAAMYWLAKMVYAGEDPRFLFRRMLIFASEDVGLADPHAVAVTLGCATAFDRVGLPEGRFPLAQAALYLATAPKSNSVFAFFDALGVIESEREGEVPTHLKDASRDARQFGHGEGYLYPHAYRDHWVAQQYLPAHMQGKVFYEPGELGYEQGIRRQVVAHREAQLEAMLDIDGAGGGEVFTYSEAGGAHDRWLQRTVSRVGEHLGVLRDRLLDAAGLQRHHLVLDANAHTGLLTWEALRRVPEGGVWSLTPDARSAEAVRQQADRLPELRRPRLLAGGLRELPALLKACGDGRGALRCRRGPQPPGRAAGQGGGVRRAARLPAGYGPAVPGRGRAAPRATPLGAGRSVAAGRGTHRPPPWRPRTPPTVPPTTRWSTGTPPTWRRSCASAGFELPAPLGVETRDEERRITEETLARWFDAQPDVTHGRPSYARHLLKSLSAAEVARVEACYRQQLRDRIVPWRTAWVYVTATPAPLTLT